MRAGARSLIAAITICSWIAVSNHCAFAAVATEIDKAQTECPFHSKPAKQKEQSSQVQCCKILRAVVFAKTKDWARNDAKFCDANFPVQAGAFVVYSSRAVAPLLLDTGPPGAFSFAELILQQSLLAHAPPFRLASAVRNRGSSSVAASVPPAFSPPSQPTRLPLQTRRNAKTNFSFNRERTCAVGDPHGDRTALAHARAPAFGRHGDLRRGKRAGEDAEVHLPDASRSHN